MRPSAPWTSAALLCVLLLSAGCAGSPAAKPQKFATYDGETVRVAGTVADDQLVPLANVTVTLEDAKTLAPVLQAMTAVDGRFDLGRAPVGDYVLQAQATGFQTHTKPIILKSGVDQTGIALQLSPIAVAVPYHETAPMKTLTLQFAAAYQINGDYNQGCIAEGVTCNAAAYPPGNMNANFVTDDSPQIPLAGVVFEESWTSTSPVCAKAVAVDLYSPDAVNTITPSLANPHYWTNYPHPTWKTSSPIIMTIPRNETGNKDSINDPARVKSNGAPLWVRGNWTIRNFPPGKGLTNLPVDANCFTDQKFDLLWTAFYIDPAPAGFTARK